MATLQNIRNRGPLLAVIIGFALMAFILGDFINQGSSMFTGDQFEIAQINGESISIQEYQEKLDEAVAIYQMRTGQSSITEELKEDFRREVWDQMVQSYTLGDEYSELGIGVSSDEVFDMVQGQNIDPIVQALFANRQTGVFNPNDVIQFLKNMEQDNSNQSKAVWMYYENQIIINRMYSKYMTLITKGLNVSTAQATKEYKERNHIVDFDFVQKSYSSMSDSAVQISESEMKAYYDKHESDFEQEASRDIAYVTFDVVPSEVDKQAAEDWINSIAEQFVNETEDKQFINYNSDVRFNPAHYSTDEFNNAVLDTFLQGAAVGEVYGPYLENGTYKLAKLTERKTMPDSIKVRHILIQPNGQTIADMPAAVAIADSLKAAIAGGDDFTLIAAQFSSDQETSKAGGDLGWITEEMNFIEELKTAIYESATNETRVVETNYGVHIIQVTEKTNAYSQVQVGFIERKVEPSQQTYQNFYADASRFAGENTDLTKFNTTLKEKGLIRKLAPSVQANDKVISGLVSPREMVRWAFKAEKEEVSPVFEFGNRYVVATVIEIREKGTAPIDQVEVANYIKTQVAKTKKAELFIKEFDANGDADLNSFAQKMNLTVGNAKNISFTSNQIPNVGYEPAVISTSVNVEKGAVTKAIEGNNGVYVLSVTSITSNQEIDPTFLTNEKNQLISRLQSRIYKPNGMNDAFDVLKGLAEIRDGRAKFY